MTDRIITLGSGADRSAARLVPIFSRTSTDDFGFPGLQSMADERWFVSSCISAAGPDPGVAICSLGAIPGNEDRSAFSIAWNPDGIAAGIKIGTRCAIAVYYGTTLVNVVFVGSVVNVGHYLDSDSLAVMVFDDRHLLRDVRIIGRWIVSQSGSPPWPSAYQQIPGAHFNPGGRANMMRDINGDVCFAPFPDFGLIEDDDPGKTTVEGSKKKAAYWTLGTILQYLRAHYSSGAARPADAPWMQVAPEGRLEWPPGFGSTLDSETIFNFDTGTGQTFSSQGAARKGRDINLDGLALLDALALLLATGGGWTVTATPHFSHDVNAAPVFKSILEIVPTRYEGGGFALQYAAGGQAKDSLKIPIITGGSYEEDGQDIVTMAVGLGDRVFVERRVDTVSLDLEPGWNDDDLTEMLTQMGSVFGSEASNKAFDRIAQTFWDVLSTWKLKTTFDPAAGTDYSAYGRANVSRTPWPTLLSYIGENPSQLQTAGQKGPRDYINIPFPVQFEIKDSTGTWVRGPELDGLTIHDNGLIHVPQLRLNPLSSAAGSWRWTGSPFGITDGKADITVQAVRCTIAVPLDWRLTSIYGTTNHSVDHADFAGLWLNMPDEDRIEKFYQRTQILDLGNRYKLWLRKDSFPRAESWITPPQSKAPDKTLRSDALRSDEELLKNHVAKAMLDGGRLRKGGTLRYDGWLVTSIKPGLPIVELQPVGAASGARPFPIRSVVRSVAWRMDGSDLVTELQVW